MALDLIQLTSAFTGVQLIVIVFVLMELRSIRAAEKIKLEADGRRDAEISSIGKKLSNVMGRLKIEED